MDAILKDLSLRYETDVALGAMTWYGVGGRAQALAHPSSAQQLAALTARCMETQTPIYVLGAGANLLVQDQGVAGVVVKLDDPAFRQLKIDKHIITVGAGYDLAKLVLETAKAGLGGLECLAGIPATVGGAVRMNAGGAFGDIGRSVSRVQVMDQRGQAYYRDRDDLVFGYRKSNVAARFITEVEFELTPDDSEALMRRVKEVFAYKTASQPLRDHSAGCAFKNPPPEVGASAGQLVDRAGLKTFRIGNAEVSQQHANFIIAHKGATAADILAVMTHVQQVVADKFGVQLEREVVVWP